MADRTRTLVLAGVVLFVAMSAFVVIRRPGSDDIRLRCWRVGITDFANDAASWAFGTGPDTFEHVWRRGMTEEDRVTMPNTIHGNAHNDWLQMLITTGVVGFALFLAVQVQAVRALVPYSAQPHVAAALGSAAAMFVFGKFSPLPLAATSMLSLLLGNARACSCRVTAFPLWAMRVLCFLALWVAVCHIKAEYLLKRIDEGRVRDVSHAVSVAKAASDVAPWSDDYFRVYKRFHEAEQSHP